MVVCKRAPCVYSDRNSDGLGDVSTVLFRVCL